MKKTLVYLEDNGYLLKQTVKFLKEDGFDVIDVSRIDQIIDFFQKKHNDIDCIITDLNMEEQWLGEYCIESEGGLLSGWVWLRRFFYSEEKNMHIPCIIYSGYIPELKHYLKERGESQLLHDYPVSLISKGGNNNNGYRALIKKLNDILPD